MIGFGIVRGRVLFFTKNLDCFPRELLLVGFSLFLLLSSRIGLLLRCSTSDPLGWRHDEAVVEPGTRLHDPTFFDRVLKYFIVCEDEE